MDIARTGQLRYRIVKDRCEEGNNEQNSNQIQTLGSLTDFSSHIPSSPFAVSLLTLQSPIYTSSSPSPMPSR